MRHADHGLLQACPGRLFSGKGVCQCYFIATCLSAAKVPVRAANALAAGPTKSGRAVTQNVLHADHSSTRRRLAQGLCSSEPLVAQCTC